MASDTALLVELATMMKAAVERCVTMCSSEDNLKCFVPDKAQRNRILCLAGSDHGHGDLQTLFILSAYHYMFDLLVAHDERTLGRSQGKNIVFLDTISNTNI